jgi:EKC/KEOPS complex subunit CGI121/TPRKB
MLDLISSDILLGFSVTILQISEAIKQYGVSDTTTDLFVVRIESSDTAMITEKMNAVVTGNMVSLSTLNQITDWSFVKKVRSVVAIFIHVFVRQCSFRPSAL